MTQTALTATEQLHSAAKASEPVTFRQVPHNIEAEQLLLGAILVNNEVMDRVSRLPAAPNTSTIRCTPRSSRRSRS